jgi:hypothetical protein
MRNNDACSDADELRASEARVSDRVSRQTDIVMLRFEIQLATVFMLLISSGSTGAQVPSGQCGQTSGSCSLSSKPQLIGALPLTHQEPAPLVTVTFDGRLLSVHAHGASLRSVLAVIGKQTGTEVDFGAGSDAGGVYVDIGPATVRDVLRDLLNGSRLNYVMLRSRSDPGFVERLVILGGEHEPTGVDHPSSAVVAAQPASPKLYGAGFAAGPEEDGSAASIVPAPDEPQAVPPAIAAQPSADPSILKYQQQYQQALADAASSGKSRAQIIDELQKLQQKELDDQYSQSHPH